MSKIRKLCYDFELGDCVQVINSQGWNGRHGIIDSIQHGIWADNHAGYGTEYLVRDLTGEANGRMVLRPDQLKKVDNPFTDLKRIKELVGKGKVVNKNLTLKEKAELSNLLNKY